MSKTAVLNIYLSYLLTFISVLGMYKDYSYVKESLTYLIDAYMGLYLKYKNL